MHSLARLSLKQPIKMVTTRPTMVEVGDSSFVDAKDRFSIATRIRASSRLVEALACCRWSCRESELAINYNDPLKRAALDLYQMMGSLRDSESRNGAQGLV